MDIDYTQRGWDSSRVAGIGFVVALHLTVAFFLVTALGSVLQPYVAPPIQGRVISEAKAKTDVDVQTNVGKIPIPIPTTIGLPTFDTQSNAPTQVTTQAVPVAHHRSIAPRLEAAGSCTPTYPSVSRDLEEQGAAIVRFTVNADGSVAAPSIVKSSGFPRLDSALLGVVGSCIFVPGTVDGVAEPMQKQIMYNFVLDDQ